MIYERVLIGNDGSSAALMAVRAGAALATAEAEVTALTVAEIHFAAHTGYDAPDWDAEIRAEAAKAQRAAEHELQGRANATAKVTTGYAAPRLLRLIEELHADLVAVGAHGSSRAAGMILGSVATELIHKAPCSVLVARGEIPEKGFPQRILVGLDTSPASAGAEAIAASLAAASGSRLRRLTATGGKRLPDDAVIRAELDSRAPVEALVDAGSQSDLLVVGSRGLHGLAALGSVAERVAHRAPCSVLIVRAALADEHAGPGGLDPGSGAAVDDPAGV